MFLVTSLCSSDLSLQSCHFSVHPHAYHHIPHIISHHTFTLMLLHRRDMSEQGQPHSSSEALVLPTQGGGALRRSHRQRGGALEYDRLGDLSVSLYSSLPFLGRLEMAGGRRHLNSLPGFFSITLLSPYDTAFIRYPMFTSTSLICNFHLFSGEGVGVLL